MAVDAFLKIDGIEGESVDKSHGKEIDILAWSWGLAQGGSFHQGGGGGAGKVSVQDLSFTHYIDKSSPVAVMSCCDGSQYKSATLVVRKAGKTPLEYLKIVMTDVMVTSVSMGGSAGEERLTQNVTLNFAKFKITYQPQKADGGKDGGPVESEWDIAKNNG